MKHLFATALVTAGLVSAPVAAQDVIVEQQESSELRGDWVLGARVTSTEEEAIGSIEDLIINEEDGSIIAAVVSVGGFLGFGSKQIAVDWSELEINWDANEILLELTREEAEDAEDYVYREREYEPAPAPETGTGTGSVGTTGDATNPTADDGL